MRGMTPLGPIIAAKLMGGNGQGASVTPDSVLTALEGMDSSQQSAARAAIGATDAATSIPDNVKQKLLACFADAAWADDQGQTHYDELEAALYPLDSISAVYTPGTHVVYDTDSLDSLKPYLTVTATYQGGQTATIASSNYTLSGTLTVGTSTVTVSYGGKTTTFTVTVETHLLYSLENREFDTESINTGVKIFETDQDWTIALDIELTTNPTSGNGASWRLIGSWGSDINAWAASVGKASDTATTMMFQYIATSSTSVTGIAVGTGRYRLVVTHTKNSNEANLKIRKDSGTALSFSREGTFQASSATVRFGANNSNYALPKGTINKAYVYDTVLSSSQINEFLGL